MNDKWLELAKEIAGNKVKTEEGLFALRCNLREINNHLIELGEEYIKFNLQNGNYDKDPFCNNRLRIYELEELERAMEERPEIRSYKPHYLFNYHDKDWHMKDINEIIDEMIKEGIIKIKIS